MEKHMLKYLDVAFPHVFKKKLDTGTILFIVRNKKCIVITENILQSLQKLFTCSAIPAIRAMHKWSDSRPEYITKPHIKITLE